MGKEDEKATKGAKSSEKDSLRKVTVEGKLSRFFAFRACLKLEDYTFLPPYQ